MKPAPRVRGPIKRPGGKYPLLPDLLPLIAARPHTCYCEAFAGGLAVLLNKPRSQVEVINDSDGDLVNFYKVAKNHAPELARLMRGQINSRILFHEARAHRPHETDCQRAAHYFFLNATSFGSDGATFGVKRTSGGGAASRFKGNLPRLRALARRMDGVIVEHLDWQRALKLYDKSTTLFFLDPPYVGGAPEMRALWRGWEQHRVTRALGIAKDGTNKRFGELIVCSPLRKP